MHGTSTVTGAWQMDAWVVMVLVPGPQRTEHSDSIVAGAAGSGQGICSVRMTLSHWINLLRT